MDRCIDERDIELVLGLQLVLGGGEPLLDYLRRFRPALGKPAHQFIPRRRSQENQQCAGHGGPNLPGAHYINFKQARQSDRQPFRHWRFRCSVIIAGVARPFEQLAAGGHFLELVFADKEILPARNLAGSRRPSGYRD